MTSQQQESALLPSLLQRLGCFTVFSFPESEPIFVLIPESPLRNACRSSRALQFGSLAEQAVASKSLTMSSRKKVLLKVRLHILALQCGALLTSSYAGHHIG